MLLPVTMAAANALLDALGIPWQVIVHHESAELEIDALCPGLGGDHDAAFLAEVIDEGTAHVRRA